MNKNEKRTDWEADIQEPPSAVVGLVLLVLLFSRWGMILLVAALAAGAIILAIDRIGGGL